MSGYTITDEEWAELQAHRQARRRTEREDRMSHAMRLIEREAERMDRDEWSLWEDRIHDVIQRQVERLMPAVDIDGGALVAAVEAINDEMSD